MKFTGIRIYGLKSTQIAEYWVRDYPKLGVFVTDGMLVVHNELVTQPLVSFNILFLSFVRYEYD